jgi:hypothetical protein
VNKAQAGSLLPFGTYLHTHSRATAAFLKVEEERQGLEKTSSATKSVAKTEEHKNLLS